MFPQLTLIAYHFCFLLWMFCNLSPHKQYFNIGYTIRPVPSDAEN